MEKQKIRLGVELNEFTDGILELLLRSEEPDQVETITAWLKSLHRDISGLAEADITIAPPEYEEAIDRVAKANRAIKEVSPDLESLGSLADTIDRGVDSVRRLKATALTVNPGYKGPHGPSLK
jgi:hypothetical protein